VCVLNLLKMNDSGYELYGDEINTLVCRSFSDGYYPLFSYLRDCGAFTPSRLGDTKELLTFKTVILEPLKRSTVAFGRHVNIFFHLAESLWVLSGRDDLKFIALFNSRFRSSSDDGISLHGAYGKRLRSSRGQGGAPVDQFYEACAKLNEFPDLRRLVVSLWDSGLDLGNPSRDLPCNTQLMFRVREGELYTTVVNRSNDLHWGVIANIFQFSLLSEVMALLLDLGFVKQTHIAQSLHYYLDNPLNQKLNGERLHDHFYALYPPSPLVFNFAAGTDEFRGRFDELDGVLRSLPELILEAFDKGNEPEDLWHDSACFCLVSDSFYDIARLLLLYACYQKKLLTEENREALRKRCVQLLLDTRASFRHQDYWALAVNHFLCRMNGRHTFVDQISDVNLGNY